MSNQTIPETITTSMRPFTRPVPEHKTCEDCGVIASIDGHLPVDMFEVTVTFSRGSAVHTIPLCLGDLATRRMAGQKARRV